MTLPFLALLLVGAGQFGAIALGQVSIDTAAREGARVAAENPGDLSFASGPVPTTYDCPIPLPRSLSSGSQAADAICVAVGNASGTLLPGQVTRVVITANHPVSSRPDDVVRAAAVNCGSQASISGFVSGVPGAAVATVSTSNAGQTITTQATPGSGYYQLCVPGSHSTVQYNVVAVAPGDCSGSYPGNPVLVSQSNSNVQNVNIALSCSTATTSSSSSSTSSSSSSSSTSTSTSTSTVPPPTLGPAPQCTNPPGAPATGYVNVVVDYRVPIFVPFVNRLFGDPGQTYRTVTANVTMPIDPCNVDLSAP